MTTQSMNLNYMLLMMLGLVSQPFKRFRHQSDVSDISGVIMVNVDMY